MSKTGHPQLKVYFSFFIYAVALGAMFPRMGDLRTQLDVGETALGLMLMGLPLGVQIALIFGGQLVEKMGFRAIMLCGVPLIGFAEAFASLGSSPIFFFGVLVFGGLGVGVTEIVVNLEADRVEYHMDRRIMNRSHAFWSFGFFTAGIVGAFFAQLAISTSVHLFAIAIATSLLAYLFLRDYQAAAPRGIDHEKVPKFVKPSRGILLIVAFTLSAMLLEGAGIDWSVIFMRDVFETAPFISGMALAVGAATQAGIRFFADGYVDRYGPQAIARASIVTLGIGVIFVTFSIDPISALLGFALMGIGNAVVFPLAMSAAAQRTDRPAATNVAALAQLAFVTFLIAPAILGFIAENFGIRYSFGLGIPLVVLSWFTLRSLSPPK